MRHIFALSAVVALAVSVQAGDLKSGPQEGQAVPGPFVPLNINGERAGEKNCLYCSNGNNPVVMIFARTADCPMAQKLIKKIDATTAKNQDKNMGSFVVFLSDEEKLESKLEEMVKDCKLKETVLSIDTPTGPEKYNVAKDADLTVVLYTNRKVKANYAFEQGKITDKDIEKIVADVSKIVPQN